MRVVPDCELTAPNQDRIDRLLFRLAEKYHDDPEAIADGAAWVVNHLADQAMRGPCGWPRHGRSGA